MITDAILDTLSSAGWPFTRFEQSEGYNRAVGAKRQGERLVEAFTLPIALKVTCAATSALLSVWEPLFIPVSAVFTYFSLKTFEQRRVVERLSSEVFELKKKIFYTYEAMRIIRRQTTALTIAQSNSETKKQAKKILKEWQNCPKVLFEGCLEQKANVESCLKTLISCDTRQIKTAKTAAQTALQAMTAIGITNGPLAKGIEATEQQVRAYASRSL